MTEYTENYLDGVYEWLDFCDPDHDVWQIVEEAACLASSADPNDLHKAGRVYGMAEALRAMYNESCGTGYEPEQTQSWIEFIECFAEDNYERGERIA